MAVKSWYLSVVDSATHKPVVHRMFFTAPEMNRFIKEQNIVEEYKKPQYYIVKENYWWTLSDSGIFKIKMKSLGF